METIRIGGASGYWGDSSMAMPQFLDAGRSGRMDYIVFDYLAEITMSIMARARAKDERAGYARDFVSGVLANHLEKIAETGVKLVSNAGGVNPEACGTAIRKLVADKGLSLKVAVVTGDDLMAEAGRLAEAGTTEMFSGERFPDLARLASMNAYIGAFPIARALAAGADIVVTGRCVDSAVTLGVCIHEFGWAEDDWDRLAAGTLAGHILECGPQATGGNFTDWEDVPDVAHIGYPIAEISADGSFVLTKPEGTGGLVSVGTAAEQMLYEIGDPQAYIVPDVVADFSEVRFEGIDTNRVHVTGARGLPATDTLKVSATYADGYRGGLVRTVTGLDADRKAAVFADQVFERAGEALRRSNLGDFTETSVEVIGAESQYGTARGIESAREVTVIVAAKHPEAAGIGILLMEATGLGLAAAPGGAGFQGGRPKPSPVIRLFSFLIDKGVLDLHVSTGDEVIALEMAPGQPFDADTVERPAAPSPVDLSATTETVPLVRLAWGRSGDKGDKANIGIIARDARYLPYIWAALTEDAVANRFSHFLEGSVERFLLPGSNAINFLLHDVLGGGGVASLRNDAQGKAYAQLLLDFPVPVPPGLVVAE